MDLTEFLERTGKVLKDIGDDLPALARDDICLYLDTGEEGLAMELLVDSLILESIGVTQGQAREIERLMRYFAVDPDDQEARRYYPALADPQGAVADLVIVDK